MERIQLKLMPKVLLLAHLPEDRWLRLRVLLLLTGVFLATSLIFGGLAYEMYGVAVAGVIMFFGVLTVAWEIAREWER